MKRGVKPFLKDCLDCGKSTIAYGPNFKRCKECGAKHTKESLKMYHKIWYKEKKKENGYSEERKAYAIEYREKNVEKRLLLGAKTRAKELGLDFNLSLEDIVLTENCPILKEKMVVKSRYAPSLDRINPNLGYIKGNVWVISRKANVMKNDATETELRRFSDWVNRYLI